MFKVGINAVGQGQIHQHGTSQDNMQRVGWKVRSDLPLLFNKKQQQNLFGKSQHRAVSFSPCLPTAVCALPAKVESGRELCNTGHCASVPMGPAVPECVA